MSDQVKRLYRSRSDRWLAGVCGGLGRYLGIDPTIIRVLFALFGIFALTGVIVYAVLWLIIPEEPEATVVASEEEDSAA